MPTLLKIDVSPRGDYSVSRKLTAKFTEQWKQTRSSGTIIDRDLVKTDLPFVDLPWIMGAYTAPEQHSPEQKSAIKVSDDLIAELLSADHIVIGTPMYNFAIPALLKAWIDHIVRLNKTFTASYEGLAKGKKVTLIVASGGVYTPGSPTESYNAETGYLKQILGFIGITDVTVVLAGGSSAVNQGKVTFEDHVASFEPQVVALAS